jgi:hypothetical protein
MKKLPVAGESYGGFRIWNLEFGMRKSCRMGSSKPDRGSTPRRQGAKGFAENKKPRRVTAGVLEVFGS